MATVGKLGEFVPECESLTAYVERVELYFEAKKIEEERKVPVFLSVLGSKTYSVLRDLLAPSKPKVKKFSELVAALTRHFEPRPIVIAERFRFHKRDQKQGESIAVFLSELRRLAASCSFGTFLEEALRDRLVCGVLSEAMQRKLLTEADLTLSRAFEIAQGIEAAAEFCKGKKNSCEQLACPIEKLEDSEKCMVEKVIKGPPRQSSGNGAGRYKKIVCFKCGRPGHIARVCPSGHAEKRESKGQMCVEADEDDTESLGVFNTVYVLRKPLSSPIVVRVKLNGKETVMELDTGAAVSIIPESVQQQLFPHSVCQPTTALLRTYTGEPITVKGTLPVKVEYGSQVYSLKVYVVQGKGPSLLGRDWLKHIRLNWKEIQMVHSGASEELGRMLKEYECVFSAELGTIK